MNASSKRPSGSMMNSDDPEWVRTCQVLGQWEAVLRIYLPRWKAHDPWIHRDGCKWKTILTRRYFEWHTAHQEHYRVIREELVEDGWHP